MAKASKQLGKLKMTKDTKFISNADLAKLKKPVTIPKYPAGAPSRRKSKSTKIDRKSVV